ncbi:MAG: DUF3667 domain-containing protein [Gammaproteobacteria bacterium]|nr:DUF3667 domain-containing protein [Gammaproteobacteria bacterium]
MIHCPNCHAELAGAFCSNCGQKDVDLERPLRQLAGEVVKETFDVDGRAFRSIRALLTRPGFLTNEYLRGRRRRYTPPLRLYLVISVLFFVVAAWAAGRGVLLDPGQNPGDFAANQAQFMANELPRLMFLLLPLFALLLKIVEYRRLYFDHVIFSLHLHSVAYLAIAAILPMERMANENAGVMIVQIVLLLAFLGYFTIAVREVYRSGWFKSAMKSLAVLLGYLIIVSAVIEMSSSMQLLSD